MGQLVKHDGVPDSLVERIKQEEGFRPKPYTDSVGVVSFGYGFTSITEAEAETLLLDRLASTQAALREILAGWSRFSQTTREALTDMGYQIGPHGVSEFTDILDALRAGDCAKAKAAALDSEWARETPRRASEVAGRLCD